MVACHLWGQSWCRKWIPVLCDNQAVVSIINKGRSNCPLIMTFMRRITWLFVCHNFILTAWHVPGHDNVIADSLSHLNFQVYRDLCPHASQWPLAVPHLSSLALD